MARFHALRIKNIRKETKDCISIAFEVPAHLAEEFAFKPGQHLTLKADIDNEDIRRNYSICTSPSENDLRIAVKKVDGGRFSNYAAEKLAVGDVMEVMTPLGSFTTPIDAGHKKYYAAFAAGSGITPVLSLMKTILEKEPGSQFTLFYGNQRSKSIIFLEEIEGLKNRYLGRLSVYHILSREYPGSDLFYGRLSKEKSGEFFKRILNPKDVDEFFICGPAEMIESVKESIENQGVDAKKIHFELFTVPGEKSRKAAVERRVPAEKILSHISVTREGKTFSFDLFSTEETILDAASQAGANLPFACRGGVCCTCKAKLLEGEVEMEVNYALIPEEVAAGYILTCQSHPKTGKVVVSFDD